MNKSVAMLIALMACNGSEDISEYIGDITERATGNAYGWFKAIKKFPKIDVVGLTNFSRLFHYFPLQSLDLSHVDTSNVTNMSSMFAASELRYINISGFNTSNVTTMRQMFGNCSHLKKIEGIENFDTSNVTDMGSMFSASSANRYYPLDLSNFDTSNVTNMQAMFYQCHFETIDISNFNMGKVVKINSIFHLNSQLENLAFGYDLGKSFVQKTNNFEYYRLYLGYASKLTHDSLMSIINGLYDLNLSYDVANGGTLYTQNLAIGATNKAKLTAEEIAVATSKGWTVS